jgi:ATPase family associated with various cellular activities (AAA)
MASYYLKSGNTYRVSSKEALDLHEKLPAGNYVIKQDPMGNLFLETIDNFEIKGKRYGDLTSNCDRILNTFNDRPATTGVMLAGEKGSGKSLLAKAISLQAAEDGIPTIVINAPWAGDKFNSFLQSIEQPCVILFDEFEKVYPSEEQEQILTLLDGVFPSKKLFVLTCNDKWRVDSHMRNRPGRIFYMLDFKGLTNDFIVEYCEDNLKNKSHIEKICNIATLFGQFNFDMLKALVEEMNRYNEAPEEALRMLNTKPEFDNGNQYSIELDIAGTVINTKQMDGREWKGNPLQQTVSIEYQTIEKDDDGDEYTDWNTVRFTATEIKKIDPATGKFVFINKDGARLTLSKIKEKSYNYLNAF